MEFHSPPHRPYACVASDGNELWRPGSFTYASSPRREPMDRTYMDRLRCKQDLQKLYEDMSESSYDLSLKDIVDPCYSISGNLKAIVAEEELKSHVQGRGGGKSRSWKNSSIPKLSFSFSFPGFRGKSRRSERPNLFACRASPSVNEVQASSASNSTSRDNFSYSKYSKSSPEASVSSMSKIHPSNQCSLCSSFTIFFKSRCLEGYIAMHPISGKMRTISITASFDGTASATDATVVEHIFDISRSLSKCEEILINDPCVLSVSSKLPAKALARGQGEGKRKLELIYT